MVINIYILRRIRNKYSLSVNLFVEWKEKVLIKILVKIILFHGKLRSVYRKYGIFSQHFRGWIQGKGSGGHPVWQSQMGRRRSEK